MFNIAAGCLIVLASLAPAQQAMSVLADARRTAEERAAAARTLLSLPSTELRSIEPLLLRTLQTSPPSDYLLSGVGSALLGKLTPDPSSIPALLDLMHKPELRFPAGYALANLEEARPAVPALTKLLRSDDPDEVEVAAFVLARMAPDREVETAVPELARTLRDSPGWVGRFNAAVALLKLGREQSQSRAMLRGGELEMMLPSLEDPQPLNRLHVSEALSFYEPPQRDFLDLLRKRLSEDTDGRVRTAAARALSKVAADPRRGKPIDVAPRALSSLPPELAQAGKAAIEWQRTSRDHDLPALRLLGGTMKGNTATIDFFSSKQGIYHSGTITMTKAGPRWRESSISVYSPARDRPYIDDFKPFGRNERAALDALDAIAAAQIAHWNGTAPPSYAASLGSLVETGAPGYVITMAAGDHAWFAEAHPVKYGKTGIHSYYIDERGIVLGSDTRGKPLQLDLP